MILLIILGCVMFAIFTLQRFVYKKMWDRGLGVTIRFDDEELFEGDQGRLLEIIENGKRLPLNMIQVKFQTDRNLRFHDEEGASTTDLFYRNDIFQINGNEKITRSLPFVAGKRGYYQILQADLVGTDLLMSTRFYGGKETKTGLYVYPRPMVGSEMQRSLQKVNGEILAKRHLMEDPFEYRGIREYGPNDEMKTINWKATAKTGQLKVNMKGETALNEVRIFINIDDKGILKKEDCVEACFRIAAGVCQAMTDRNMRISCFCNGPDMKSQQPLVIESSTGKVHLKNIYRGLARIDTAKESKDFCELFEERVLSKEGELLSVFIAPNQYTDFIQLVEQYKARGGLAIWYIPVTHKEEPTIPPDLRNDIRIIHIE